MNYISDHKIIEDFTAIDDNSTEPDIRKAVLEKDEYKNFVNKELVIRSRMTILLWVCEQASNTENMALLSQQVRPFLKIPAQTLDGLSQCIWSSEEIELLQNIIDQLNKLARDNANLQYSKEKYQNLKDFLENRDECEATKKLKEALQMEGSYLGIINRPEQFNERIRAAQTAFTELAPDEQQQLEEFQTLCNAKSTPPLVLAKETVSVFDNNQAWLTDFLIGMVVALLLAVILTAIIVMSHGGASLVLGFGFLVTGSISGVLNGVVGGILTGIMGSVGIGLWGAFAVGLGAAIRGNEHRNIDSIDRKEQDNSASTPNQQLF